MSEQRMACVALVVSLALGTGWLFAAEVPQGIFTNARNSGFSIGVNTAFQEEYSAVSPDGKELYYTNHDQNGIDYTLVATRQRLDDPFGDVRNLQDFAAPGVVLNTGSGDYPASISYDLRELYFGSEREGAAKIFVAKRAVGRSGEPFVSVEKLGDKVNSPGLAEGSPRISSDGLTLFYHVRPVSDEIYDLWMVSRESTDDLFGDVKADPKHNPRRLDEFNSPIYEEYRPTISTDGLFLFFSDWVGTSPRPGGVGSYDIWVTTRSSADAPFGEPVNPNFLWPGSKVNSTAGEVQPTISADWPAYGSKIYFTSNRPGSLEGSPDIWEATWVPPPPRAEFAVDPENGTAPLAVAVDGSASTAHLGFNIVTYEWDFGDGTETVQGVQLTHTYAGAGLYTVRLTVTDDRDFDFVDSGKSGSAAREIRVGCPAGDSSPWQAGDVGEPKFPGAFRKDGDCLQVCAGGTGISSASDQLSFASQKLQGGFVLTAAVKELETQLNGAGVGLMARESLDPAAKMAAICLEKSGASFVPRLRVRSTSPSSGTALGLPAWLRLERRGDEFIGSVSPDGTTWTEVGRKTVDLPEDAPVGIAAFGKDWGNTPFEALEGLICPSLVQDCNGDGIDDAADISSGTSKDCNENGIPDECDIASGASKDNDSNGIPDECLPPGGLRIPGDSNGDGTLDISDAVATLGFLFIGSPKTLPCGDRSAADPANLKLIDWQPDGSIDISDAVATLSFLFLGGKPHTLAPEADHDHCVRIEDCPEDAGCR